VAALRLCPSKTNARSVEDPISFTLADLKVPGDAIRSGSVEVLYPGPDHAPENLMVWVPAQKGSLRWLHGTSFIGGFSWQYCRRGSRKMAKSNQAGAGAIS
jgi:hypothetical protein